MAGNENLNQGNLNQGTQGQQEEVVEFHSEMPQVPDENVTFIPDDKLEEKIEDSQDLQS